MPYVEVDGVTVHYVEEGPPRGAGVPTAVLVHGFPVDHRLMVGAFEPVFGARATGWRRVYVDLPGMGRTAAGDVAGTDDVFRVLRGAVRELVPEGPYAVVGQSYGGYLARGLAAADPGRVAGLAVLVTVVDPVHERRDVPAHRVLVREPALTEQVGTAVLDAEDVLVVQTGTTWERTRQEVHPGRPRPTRRPSPGSRRTTRARSRSRRSRSRTRRWCWSAGRTP
nr:hypothetical protein GCM10025730_24650 [Promicromonospora thailandica]